MSIVKFLGLGLWLPDYWSSVNWHKFVYLIYNQSFHFGEGNGTPLQCSCWKILWMEEPGRLQSMGSLRVGHDWATSLSLFIFMHWRRKWQPTPVFLPGESQGRGSLVGCHLWGRTESDTTEETQQQQQQSFHFTDEKIRDWRGDDFLKPSWLLNQARI